MFRLLLGLYTYVQANKPISVINFVRGDPFEISLHFILIQNAGYDGPVRTAMMFSRTILHIARVHVYLVVVRNVLITVCINKQDIVPVLFTQQTAFIACITERRFGAVFSVRWELNS